MMTPAQLSCNNLKFFYVVSFSPFLLNIFVFIALSSLILQYWMYFFFLQYNIILYKCTLDYVEFKLL